MDQPAAISGISDPEKIRVVIFVNNQLVHVPLPEILKAQADRITELEARVTELETP